MMSAHFYSNRLSLWVIIKISRKVSRKELMRRYGGETDSSGFESDRLVLLPQPFLLETTALRVNVLRGWGTVVRATVILKTGLFPHDASACKIPTVALTTERRRADRGDL